MKLERKLLSYIKDRCDALGIVPSTTDILKHAADPEASHALHSLHIRGLVETLPFRQRGCPKRYRITNAGRNVLRRVAA